MALPGIADQLSYHTLAERLNNGYGFTFPRPWWPNTPANSPTAFWSYLYTLFLAGSYRFLGPYTLIPRLIQAVAAGLLMPGLGYRLARHVFDETAGLVTAAWIAVYGYFIYFSVALMTECFYLVGVLWALDSAVRVSINLESESHNAPPHQAWLELGLATGLTGMFRQIFLLFVPVLFVWLSWTAAFRQAGPSRRPRLARLRPVAHGAILTGFVLSLLVAPVTLFNYQQFGRVVLLNTNAGFAFFWANHPIYADRFVPVLDASTGLPTYRDLIPSELRQLNEADLDTALMRRGLAFVLDDPVRYLRLSVSRIPIYFMFWPSMESGLISNVVRVGSFGLALPFMLVGVWLWICQPHKPLLGLTSGALLLLFALVCSAIHLMSWALIRYRLPVDAVLLVFASQGLVGLLRWLLPWPKSRSGA